MRFLHTGARRGVLTPPFAQIAPVLLLMTPPRTPTPPFRNQVLT
jgi:hypothetical protein